MVDRVSFQQTVEAAIRNDTGEILHAIDLLTLSPEEFLALRRAATRDREGLNPHDAPTLVCWICGTRLWLARRRHGAVDPEKGEAENRFFKHVGAPAQPCPWYDPSKFTREQLLALQFHGQREGQEHRHLKAFLARSLARDARVSELLVEKVQIGEVLKGEWKRPDVRCRFDERRVVFELQISYTFISEVVKRDAFYQAEGSFIIWVFSQLHPRRAVVLDEKYYNKRNLFVLDEDARAECDRRGTLVLHCYYWIPRREGDVICSDPAEAFVTLDELRYPDDTYRPHYFDYDAAADVLRGQIEQDQARVRAEQAEAAHRDAEQILERGRARPATSSVPDPIRKAAPALVSVESVVASAGPQYAALMNALLTYGRNESSGQAATDAITFAAYELPSPVLREAAIQALSYPRLDALVRLAGIANGVPVRTQRPDLFSMLANVLQVSATTQRPFAFLYCAAWAAYQPHLRADKRVRYREQIQNAMDGNDRDYLFDPTFANLCTWLLPRLDRAVRLRSICDEISAAEPRAWDPSESPNRNRVAAVGTRYRKHEPTYDWRQVYGSALEARRERFPFQWAVGDIAKKHGCLEGDVFAFLSDCFT